MGWVLGMQGAIPGPMACSALRSAQWGAGQHPPADLPCERRWSPMLARVGQGEAALRRLAVSCCSRGAQRRPLEGLGHGARGGVREAAWCLWMALAGGSGCPLLIEGGPGVLPLLAVGRRSLGSWAKGRRLQLALGTHPGSGDPVAHTLWPGSLGPAPGPTPCSFGRMTCKVGSMVPEGGAVLLEVSPLRGPVPSSTSQHRLGPLIGRVWGAGRAAP